MGSAMTPVESHDLLEHFRLNATVTDQHTTHTKSQTSRGEAKRQTTAEKRWTRQRVLGTGGFGQVWLETSSGEGGQLETRAVKAVSKDGMKSCGIDYKKELLALSKFAKPDYQEEEVFVRFFGWYQNEINLYISMEYFPLGDLSLHLNDTTSEADIKQITIDLLRGLQIIHQENFAHRDLKPKNIFVVQKPAHSSSAWWVKIGDFGTSKRAVADTALHTPIDTVPYTAPEVLGYFDSTALHAGYDKAVDMWSLGCVVYELVTKAKLHPSPAAVVGYCEGRLPFPEQNLVPRMSSDGIRFLRSLVVPDPRHRLTAEDALDHNWVLQAVESYQESRSSRSQFLDIQGHNPPVAVQHPSNANPVDMQMPLHATSGGFSPIANPDPPRVSLHEQPPLFQQPIADNKQSSRNPQAPKPGFSGLFSQLGGEWKIHLDASEGTSMSLLLPARQDLATLLAEDLARLALPDQLTTLLKELTAEPVTRRVDFRSVQDLHTFETAVTGFRVLYDGVASTFAVSRGVHLGCERYSSNRTRIQIVQKGNLRQMVAFFLVRSTVNVGDNMSYSGPRVSLSDNVPDSTMFWSFGMKFVLTGSESKGTFTRSRFEQFIHNSGKHGIRLAGNMSPWSRKDSVSDFVRLDTPEYYPTEHAYISITFRSQKDLADFRSALSPQPLVRGVLGANYNEKLIWVDHAELQHVGAQWIRGFIDMHRLDSLHPDHDPNIKALFGAIDAGFKTILSLKWDYAEHDFPDAGSSDFTAELQALDRLLPIVMGKVDTLVIGNEPFIEAKPDQAGQRLNIFYEALADAVIRFRNSHRDFASSTALYMGALNRLDLPAKRTPAVERMLRFIASKSELDGVDLHLHVPTLAGHRAILEYALPRIRPDQTFIATEFSMVWHWKKHMNDVVSTHFCTKHGFPAGTKVHQVINSAIQTPMPYAQWEEFLRNEPWYMERRKFISNAMSLYRESRRLDVATYSFCPMRHRKRPFQAGDVPWMLNGVYAPSTVRLKPDGSRHENFPWAEEFRRAQKAGG